MNQISHLARRAFRDEFPINSEQRYYYQQKMLEQEGRRHLLAICWDMLHDTPQLKRIARNSYIHPNGFYKIPLIETKSAGQLRLHVWPIGFQSDEKPHDHRRPFVSYIALGKFRETIYRERTIQDPVLVGFRSNWSLAHCHPKMGRPHQDLTKCDGRSLVVMDRYEYGQGVSYFRDVSEIHDFRPTTDSHIQATICITGPAISEEAKVFIPGKGNVEVSRLELPPLSPQELYCVIGQLHSELENNRA